jgi:hypothetical protein
MTAVQQSRQQAVAESNTVSMFERLAKDPGVDVAKLEKLMELQERALARDAKSQFVSAMAAAQAEMRPVATDADNPQTRSRYASYEALDSALRPIYSKHGFALSYDTDDSPKPEHVRVLCEVMHIGGHSKTYHADMPADGKGAKGGDVMTKTHAVGSAMSYGQRYLLKGIFNVRVGEADDDGNAASALPTITVEQCCLIDDLIAEVGADRNKFLRYLKVRSVDEIPQQAFKDAVAALETKRRAAK